MGATARMTAAGDGGAPEAPPLILATGLPGTRDSAAVAAAVGVAAAGEEGDAGGVLVADLAGPARRPTILASASARRLEDSLAGTGRGASAAARGRLCWLSVEADTPLDEVRALLALATGADAVLVHAPAASWPAILDGPPGRVAGALLRAELPAQRSLAALAVGELAHRGIRTRIAARSLGPIAARRALAGLEPGGSASARARRIARGLLPRLRALREDAGQALLLTVGAAVAIVALAGLAAAFGGALVAGGRAQRAVDLAALSAARSLQEDYARLFVPSRRADGSPDPRHLERGEYERRAAAAAREAGARNGLIGLRVEFPGEGAFAPLRVAVELNRGEVHARAVAEASPEAGPAPPAVASGGGYSGPLAYRQGKPMRPDVAAAFDRLAAAARRAGLAIQITSAYRSDAEQARLFAANPDPRWVAPPGRSLHRCGTELDLGPPSAYSWLGANAPRFGFVRRYPWEAWHFGYDRGPAPCSASSAGGRASGADGRAGGGGGLPAFVPAAYRDPILRAAARWNVSAGLLSAQLMAESGFNPYAVSSAGARGIAQFMPATAQAYGLADPLDARAAIGAQAHLMSDLLRRFGSVALALAAYNAGEGAVSACGCVPPYPETQAYVARILGLLGGAGEAPPPALEVRLVA